MVTKKCPDCKEEMELKPSFSNIYDCKKCKKSWFFSRRKVYEVIEREAPKIH